MKILKSSRCQVVALISLFTTLFFSNAFSVAPPKYPDTLWIQVTYYDFHSDSSNPEFEIAPGNASGGLHTGMVATTLDGNFKPVVGPTPYFNQKIDRWFRPWRAGDFQIFNYYNLDSAYLRTRFQRYSTHAAGLVTLPYDTSFKNTVIHDSLPFLLINNTNGTYRYQDSTFFPLDGLGFGNEGRTHNYSFSMELHWKFTKIPGLTFSFTGDDDVWAFVGNKLRMDIGGIHGPLSDDFNLDLEPDLMDDSVYTLDFFYVERHVTGSSIKITTNIVSPIVHIGINAYPNDTVCPYTRVELNADVEDNVSGPRPDLAQNVQWSVLNWDGQPPSTLQQTSGEKVVFIPRYAYSKPQFVGTVFNGKDSIRDTITITVVACEPKCVYIEAGPVDLTNINALRNPQELEQISILNTAVSGQAYAIARDTSGAYVRLADSVTTTWRITPDGTALASASAQTNKKYLGIVTRIGVEGTTFAVAEEPGLCIDSVTVVIAPHYFVRLQLRDSITKAIVDTIRLTTNDIGRYTVWGLKSTAVDKPDSASSWAIANAAWNLQPDSLEVVIPPPKRTQSWALDPKTPGTGTLTLTNPDDARTEPLVVPVFITRSPPHRATIEIVSPGPHRAGDTIKAAVKIYNNDTLVPGTYCFGQNGDDPARSVYRDTLGTGGAGRPNPTIRVDNKDTLLNILSGSTYSVNQCFTNGIDTVSFVLFYAPFDPDSMHQVSVTLGGKMNARTEPFDVLPSFLDSIAIEDGNYDPLPPQTLSETGQISVTPYSDGYDEYGNRIGFIKDTKWSTTGTLTPIDEKADQTYVTAKGVPEDQAGMVRASALKGDGTKDSATAYLQVTIIGPKKTVSTAFTRDLNGNGRLDAIEIRFDRTVTLSEIDVKDFSNIVYSGVVQFTPTTLTQTDPKTLVLHLAETDGSRPQTSWTPTFNINGTVTIAATQKSPTIDGAGPVVWRVVKNVKTGIVRIELSEKVINANGSSMSLTDAPSATFNVYRVTPAGGFDTVPSFAGIDSFMDVRSDSVMILKMTNGEDLSTYNRVNLEVYPSVVKDTKNNLPHFDNFKCPVELEDQVESIQAAPNPTHASFINTAPGSLDLSHSDDHWRWASRKEGALIRVTITPDSSMSASLKIYDLVGNLVEYTYEQDFARFLGSVCHCLGNNKEASKYVLDFYWNGSNHQGMKVAPGIYKVVFYLDYHNSALADVKLVTLLGIAKDPGAQRK